MGLGEKAERSLIGEKLTQRGESAELAALSAKAHLEHLRDSLLDKAKQLEVQEKFSARGDQSQPKPELTRSIRSQIAEVFQTIRKVSGDRGE